MTGKKPAKATAGIGTVLIIALVLAIRFMNASSSTTPPNDAPGQPGVDCVVEAAPSATPSATPDTASDGADTIEQLFNEGTSDTWLTFDGEVARILPDDNEGSRHQKFIVELSTGRTILIAHNIDLAPRVPLERGDTVRIRGEYEWTERGGTVHWTHHDPDGYRQGGWIEHRGERYE